MIDLQINTPFILIFIQLLLFLQIGKCARYNVVGSQDQQQFVRLKSQYDLTPGVVLKLPIDVPEEYITLFGTLPPRLVSISAKNKNGVYGTGDVILIDLQFTIPVTVSGIPTLTLNTGCHDSSCQVKEVQSFVCAADKGMFGLRMENQFIMNIDVNTTNLQLQYKLQELTGINNATVLYNSLNDTAYSYGNRICTSVGKNVTIIFNNVTFPQYNGDVPNLKFSTVNQFADIRSGLDIGMPTKVVGSLSGIRGGYRPFISANEVVKGFQKADATAYYSHGSGTNTITFSYTVQSGDFTELLEVKSINFVNGYVFGNITGANVSTAVPNFGAGPRYMSISPSALGFNRNISITSAAPQIISVTSPNANAVYTQGDVIFIHVVYNLPVKVFRPDQILLQLESGAFDRSVPLVGLIDDYFTLEFQYTVQQGDFSTRLDTLSYNSLLLNGGAIYRRTSTNETMADALLPIPGSSSSLSGQKSIVVNTLSSQIVYIKIISKTGVSTAGDNIDFNILYENAVYVIGSPRLLIQNTPQQLQAVIRNAPYLANYSFSRALPSNDSQVVLSFQLNWQLNPYDMLTIRLPSLRSTSLTVLETLSISGSSEQYVSSALWDNNEKLMSFTFNGTVKSGSAIELVVQGRSGLFISSTGIIPSQSQFSFDIISSAVLPTYTKANLFKIVAAVGFASLSLSISPPALNTALNIGFAFSVPETLQVGDTIALYFKGFNSSERSLYGITVSDMPYFRFDWSNSSFLITVTLPTSQLSFVVYPSRFLSISALSTGVGVDSVTVTASMENNGYLDSISIQNMTRICGSTLNPSESNSVSYLTKKPLSASAVQFTWQVGPADFDVGDSVLFTLPYYNSSLGMLSRMISHDSLSGSSSQLFTVSISGPTVTFEAVAVVPALESITLLLDTGAGLVVPPTGIRPHVDFFSLQIVAATCKMSTPLKIFFTASGGVVSVSNLIFQVLPKSSLALGSRAGLFIQFDVFSSFAKKDVFFVTIPNFSRNILIDPRNNSIVSNANLTTRYNRLAERLEFTFQSGFDVTQNAIISVLVQYAEEFAVPLVGMSNDDFQLSIYSKAAGQLTQQIMDGPCLGFCSGSLIYSTPFKEEMLTLTFNMSYSQIIRLQSMNLTINLNDISLHGEISGTISIYSNASTPKLLNMGSLIITKYSNYILARAPVTIPAQHHFVMAFHGLYYTNTSSSITPQVSIYDSRIGGSPMYSFAAINVLDRVHFSKSVLSFRYSLSTMSTVVEMTLRPSPNLVLNSGDFIAIYLPEFQVLGNNAHGLQLSPSQGVNSSVWDSTTSQLILYPNQLIDSSMEIDLEIFGFIVPSVVLQNTSNCSYSIGLRSSIGMSITGITPIQQILELVTLQKYSLAFQMNDSSTNINHLSGIDIEITLSAPIQRGNIFTIEIPYLFQNSLNASENTVYMWIEGSLTQAVWLISNSSILVEVEQVIHAGITKIYVNTTQSFLQLTTAGIPSSTYSAIYLYQKSGKLLAFTETLLPCIGICSASLTLAERKAGYPTLYNVSILLGFSLFSQGDTISLQLEGFTKSLPLNENRTLVSQGYGNFSTRIFLTWDDSTASLVITPAPNATLISPFINFQIPQNFGLKCPSSGIRFDNQYVVNWTLANGAETYGRAALSVSPVGFAVQSTVEISPVRPSSLATMTFSWTFSDQLQKGDQIYIYLNKYSVPNGAFIVYNSSIPAAALNVTGVAALDDYQTNPDGSIHVSSNQGYLIVTIDTDILAGDVLQFKLLPTSGAFSSGIRLPVSGVYHNTVPRYAVVSKVAPIATGSFLQATSVGSLSPSQLSFEITPNNSMSIITKFVVNCPIFEDDYLVILVPNLKVVNSRLKTYINITRVNSSSAVAGGGFSVKWLRKPTVLQVKVAKGGYVLSGPLNLVISITNVAPTDQIVYPNDIGYQYSLQSSSCMIRNSSFDSSSASHLVSSEVAFKNNTIIGSESPIRVSMTPQRSLRRNDTIRLQFPAFRLYVNQSYSGSSGNINVTHVFQLSDASACLNHFATASYSPSISSLTFLLKVDSECMQMSEITFKLQEDLEVGILLPSTDVTEYSSTISIRALRWSNSSLRTLYQGFVQTVQPVVAFSHSQIIVGTPIPSTATDLTISWTLTEAISVGDVVSVVMRDFTRVTSGLVSNEIVTITGSAARFMNVTWNDQLKTLHFRCLSDVHASNLMTAYIPQVNAFNAPSNGIGSGTTAYEISLKRGNTIILSHIISQISVVPIVQAASISFIASDYSRSYNYGGDYNTLQLNPGHELTEQDIGAEIVIDGSFYQIVNVEGELLTLNTAYHGTRVLLGSPSISINTPPFRYANYLNGSNTAKLIFRYSVRRGDLSNGVGVFNPAGTTFNTTHQSLEFHNGNILRLSQSPAIVVSTIIPSYAVDYTRQVNTDRPTIVELISSSIANTYSAGQKVDFQVKFNNPVSVDDAPYTKLQLLLDIHPFGRVIAYYSSGSGTNTIVFVYTVNQIDDSKFLGNSTYEPNNLLYSYVPLRVITTFHFTYLRRDSTDPIVDASVDFPMNTIVDVPSGVKIVGIAPKVISMWVSNNSRNDNFTAGDNLYLYVRYSSPVKFATSNNASIPYIWLDLGSYNGSIPAQYFSMLDDHTLAFSYTITINDRIKHGLCLLCTCKDYFNRTFMITNGSSLYSHFTNSSASLLLANSSDANELLLRSDVVIDNSVPYVEYLSTNASDSSVHLSPGDMVLISVHFSNAVTVYGIIKLILKGDNTECSAYFHSGNNTNTINFLYMVSFHSGVSKLDCTNASSMSTKDGKIFRLSDNPTILANSGLPIPGSQDSLGLFSSTTIDTTPRRIVSVSTISGSTRYPSLSTASVGLNLFGNKSIFLHYSSEYVNLLDYSTTVNHTDLSIDNSFDENTDISVSRWGTGNFEYSRLILMDAFSNPLRFLPLQGGLFTYTSTRSNNYWWSVFNVQSKYKLQVNFDRNVEQENAVVTLNTGSHLNKALSSPYTHVYFLVVYLSLDKTAEQFYRLQYGGYQTVCISVGASAKGPSSVQDSLDSIPAIKKLLPIVNILETSSSAAVTYEISFTYLPTNELYALSPDQIGQSCPIPVSDGQVTVVKDKSNIIFEYNIQSAGSIVMMSSSVIKAGRHALKFQSSNGISISSEGLTTGSARLSRISSYGKVIAQTLVQKSSQIPDIVRSSLSFNGQAPNSSTGVAISLCTSGQFVTGDSIQVKLPNFNISSTLSAPIPSSSSCSSLLWLQHSSCIQITLLDNCACISESIPAAIGFVLPDMVVYDNTLLFEYSISSPSLGTVEKVPFQEVSAIGISDFSIFLSNPVIGQPSRISINFEIVADFEYSPIHTHISLCLPRFYTNRNTSVELDLVPGPDSHAFSARWSNATGCILIQPIVYIYKSEYSFTIDDIKPTRSLMVPSSGLYSDVPPTFAFHSEHWSTSLTAVSTFPHLYGNNLDSQLTFQFIGNATYYISAIEFQTTLSRHVAGPGSLILQLPCVSNKYGDFVFINSTQGYSILWSEKMKTLTVKSQVGWTRDIALALSVNTPDTEFYINSQGIEDSFFTNMTFAIIGSNGFLSPLHIAHVQRIPRIQYASVTFLNTHEDLFEASLLSLKVELDLNFKPAVGDTFFFDLYGIPPVLGGVRENNPCFVVTSNSSTYTLKYTSISVLLSNISSTPTNHCQYTRKLVMYFTAQATNSSKRSIIQFHTSLFHLSWNTSTSTTGQVSFDIAPVVGITYSRLDISNPVAGESSDLSFSILTATIIRKGDVIVLGLPDFEFNTSSMILYDNYNNSWITQTNSSRGFLSLSATNVVHPSGYRFSFVGRNKAVLPSVGITAGQNNIYTVTIARDGNELQPQAIKYVTPVGFVNNIVFHPHRIFTYQRNSAGFVTGAAYTIGFSIMIETNSPLDNGDIISLKIPQYIFIRDVELQLPSAYSDKFKVELISAQRILQVTLKSNMQLNSLYLETLPSYAIQLASDCTMNQCPMLISIISQSCPVTRQLFHSDEVFTSADTAIRFYHWSNTPSMYPSESPTVFSNTSAQPVSSTPTISPVVPTIIPTTEPASTYSASPTNVFQEQYFVIEVTFSLQRVLLIGSVLEIKIPQLVGNGTMDITVMAESQSQPYWTVQWINTNTVIACTVQRTLLPGSTHILRIGSGTLRLNSHIIYAYNPQISYKLVQSNFTFESGVFPGAYSSGLKDSSLSLAIPIAGTQSEIKLAFSSDDLFSIGDTIIVTLPNFLQGNVSAPVVLVGDKLTLDAVQYIWDASVFQLSLTFLNSVHSVYFTIPLSASFTIPAAGVNHFVNTPTVNLVTYDGKFFSPTSFERYTSVAGIMMANITFLNPVAGTESPIDIILFSKYTIYLQQYDVIEFGFPLFWSLQSSLEAVSFHNSSIRVTWVQCREVLQLTFLQAQSFSTLELIVTGMRLPKHGVSEAVAKLITFDSNSSASGLLSLSNSDMNIHQLGEFSDTSLTFHPLRLQELISMKAAITYSEVIDQSVYLHIHIPGVTLSVNNPMVYLDLNTLSSQESVRTVPLNATWLSQSHNLVLKMPFSVPKNTSMHLFINNSLQLSSTGQLSTDPYDVVSFSIHNNYGMLVSSTPVTNVSKIGLVSGLVKYFIPDMSQKVSILFELQLSGNLLPGDNFTIESPVLRSQSSSSVNLALLGDQADNNFGTSLTASFVESTGTFVFVVTAPIVNRLFTIFVGSENGLFLNQTINHNQTLTHYFSAGISSIGTINKRAIDHYPQNLFDLLPSALSVTHCTSGIGCDVGIDFTLSSDLEPGDMIVLSHRSFSKLGSESVLNLTSTTDDSHFSAAWRSADNVHSVQLAQGQIDIVRDGFIRASADYVSVDANVTFPAGLEIDNDGIVSYIPQILSVFASYPFDALVCNDSLDIFVVFDKPVLVQHPATLRMLLNTQEYANYYDGNLTSILRFRYYSISPLVTQDLAPLGPGALEFFTANTLIVDATRPTVAINTTIPGPYGYMLRSSAGYHMLQVLECSALASIIEVVSYSKPFVTYAAGDVLDVQVVFNRPVQVHGSPYLLLTGDTNASSVYHAQFANVSALQWIDVASPGWYSLSYFSSQTACIYWDDSATLLREVSALKGIDISLPVSIEVFYYPSGFRYKLVFNGVAPYILKFQELSCDYEIPARVSIHKGLWNSIIFRYNVAPGDVQSVVNYINTTSLTLNSSTIVLSTGGLLFSSVNVTLPDTFELRALATSGIRFSAATPEIISVYSNISSSLGRPATSGDLITIAVNYSAPVYVPTNVTAYFKLELINYFHTSSGRRARKIVRRLELSRYQESVLFFEYLVQVGDSSHTSFGRYLSSTADNTITVQGGNILLRSAQPSIIASYQLPANTSGHALTHSQIVVNATSPPIILNVNSTHEGGVVHAGEEIFIAITFSSNVSVIESSITPFIFFLIPSGALMRYYSGSGTNTILFLYEVQEGNSANQTLSFSFILQEGYLRDSYGNTFSTCSDSGLIVYHIRTFVVDTTAPVVKYVNTTNLDGTYYSGSKIVVYVVFNKPVVILGGSPSLQLLIQYPDDDSSIARYISGNGSDILYFEWTIPPPNYNFPVQSPMKLDYGGISALYSHLNGCSIRDAATNPTTEANVLLPLFDQSFLIFHREVYISFDLARVNRVYSVTSDGTYSAGDEILIAVEFTQKVMVFTPPTLRLVTGAYNRSALFVDGNCTEKLVFKYTVQLGDSAKKLDYIDTRYPPYKTINQLRTLALSTDVLLTESFLNETSSTIFEYPTHADGGIFMASETIKVPCYMDLPLPGQTSSLSRTSSIVIDPTPPYIKKVTVPIPDGTYGDNVVIPVVTIFSANVLVGGCPRILFNMNGVDKYATYVSGGGGSSILFHYTVSYTDSVLDWDYFDRYSFQSIGCNITQQENLDAVLSPLVYILRSSIDPQVYANLTMPWVKYVESVIAPVSITGGGKHINLAGAQAVPRLIWTTTSNFSTFSLGDIVDIYVGYSRAVLFPLTAYINLTDRSGSQISIYSSQQVNDTTIRFSLAVRENDLFQNISYFDVYSLRTQSSCSIIDKQSNACAAQNLPPPFSTKSNALDSVSPKGLKIDARLSGEVAAMRFEFVDSNSFYTTGSLVTMVVSFSTDVVVIGSPMINLFLDGLVFNVMYKHQVSPTSLVFTAQVDSAIYQGNLRCTAYSAIALNGGMIIKTSNFLPLLPVNTSLSKFCCPNTCENPTTVIIRKTPVVLRVYSTQLGVFSAPESIVFFVQMSAAVKVIGSPTISLDLYGHPNATFVSVSKDTLQFQYTVRSSDYTSSLDYVSIYSLQASFGKYDGIYLLTEYANITANLTLPYRGAANSLGREASIVINNGRANIVSTFAMPTQSTSGDEVKVIVRYSEAMHLTDSTGKVVSDTTLFPVLLKLQLSIDPTSEGVSVEDRIAYLKDIQGTDVTFVYDVTSKDPTGSIYFANSFPLMFNNSELKSIKTGTQGPKKFLDSISSKVLASIDNNIPVVVSAYSPNVSTTFPFGVGDVIDIYVEMSLGVVVYVVPRLALTLNNRVGAYAEYIPLNASLMKTQSVKVLHFRYTVASGDSATPLEYTSSAALSGFLLRYSSSNPTIVADLTLPEPFSLGSIGYCCNVQVESSKPYIQFLNPLKRVGIYGENETIFILARFNKPVVVYGTPSLKLNVGSGVGFAKYVPKINEYDIIIDISETDVIFQYIVQRYDNVLSLYHTDAKALELTGGSRILHRTNSPVLPADISLRDPSDKAPINNMVDRQWKFRFPHSVEVLLRDFYHTKPDSLTASIQHVGYTSTLFSGCCTGKSFGNSYPRSRTGTNATSVNMDAGVGGDFMFSDTMAVNIATKGSVTQSSTKVSGNKATDNNVDPLIGDNSVSETSEETDPWWQILLPSSSVVQTIVIWAREPQEWIPPVVSYTIKGLAKYPQGFYKLSISNIDLTNGSYAALVTPSLSMSASGIDVRAAIQLLPGVGNVEVTKKTLPLCASDFTGCGEGFEHGYGYIFELQFLSLRVALPTVKIVGIEWIGQQTSAENITAFDLPVNVQPYQIVTHVDTKNLGYYIQTSAVTLYGKGVPVPESDSSTAASAGSNEWLTPFWVFLFDSLPPTGINASIEQSVWYQRYDSIDKLLNIVLKKPYNASYLKIQREGYGFLSLAEVQVYEKRLNTLGSYELGSPVTPSYLTNNYQAEVPLGSAFQNVEFDGRWLIQLTQDFSIQRDPLGFSGSYGTISEVVLVITDLAGVVHSYYQDLKAQIQALPKYGRLITTSPHTSSPYGDWREAFEVGAGGQLTPKLGLERSLGYCYGNQASYCANSFGVGPLLNSRQLGDTPEIYDFRDERVVLYEPSAGYLGPDFFTYIIYDGLNVQTHSSSADNMRSSINEVTIHVRKCRRFQAEQYLSMVNTLHPLCVCAQTELSLVNNTAICDSARVSVCTNSTGSSASTGLHNFYYDPDKFSSMCLSCFDPTRGLRSGDCVSQTIRSVSLVTSRGLCSLTPPMDCSAETITTPGREKVNYLTLQPPTLFGSFSKLHNSFGAYGWYNTPTLT